MSERTPGPWTIWPIEGDQWPGIDGGDDQSVVVYGEPEEDGMGIRGQTLAQAKANALFIVRAVNFHDDLVKALTDLLKLYVDLVESGDAGFWDADKVSEVIAARAALLPVGRDQLTSNINHQQERDQ